jgi:hypothetical protein
MYIYVAETPGRHWWWLLVAHIKLIGSIEAHYSLYHEITNK